MDPSYTIGPGDEIILMLWGETQFRQVLEVNREGFIFIPEVGQVFVNGLNLNLLESKLFKVLSKSYGSLNPQSEKATTFLDISLGNLRPLRIQVLGEVNQPGSFTVSPSTTLFSSLYFFNGPTTLGSLRDIKLIRGGQEITSIDFYDYLQTGKKPNDKQLQIDDVIFIPKRKNTIKINGEINRPGIYELTNEENLENLLEIAGGLKVSAYIDHAQIDRVVPFGTRVNGTSDRVLVDVSLKKVLNGESIFELEDGDEIRVSSIFDQRGNIASIQGAISRPGEYNLGDSLSLSGLIEKAGGLQPDAYMSRVDIIRTSPFKSETLIKLDLEKVMSTEFDDNIKLLSSDRVVVYSASEMMASQSVSISGYVKKPGRYPLRENFKLYDLLFNGGGLIDRTADPLFFRNVFLGRADLVRFESDGLNKIIKPFNLGSVLEDENSNYNFQLLPGDEVVIYSKEVFNKNRRVNISGSINKPGAYELKSNMKILDLILEAGGVSKDVFSYSIEITRLNRQMDGEGGYARVIELEMLNDYSFLDHENVLDSTFFLEPYDFVSIRENPFSYLQKNVKIQGEVFFPGSYILLSQNETIRTLIDRAGGLNSDAEKGFSVLVREGKRIQIDLIQILKNKNKKYDISLLDGDALFIFKKLDIVEIKGQVNSPGFYSFIPGSKTKDFINRAGGLTTSSNKKDIFVRYKNGKSKQLTFFKNPKIKSGSEIYIGKKEEKEPFDSTEYFKEVTSIFANLVQAISIIIIASQ